MEKEIEKNKESEEAIDLILNTKRTFMLTGWAWTWKTTTILEALKRNLSLPKEKQKKVQILATTWTAAQNYEFWETYHSFFKIFWESLKPLSPEEKKVIAYFDVYIIDEASMISSSQFDLINHRLQKVMWNDELFWWKQIVFIWDFRQAPPVVTDDTKNHYEKVNWKKYDEVYKSIFFFDALSFPMNDFKIIELKKTYRQVDITLQVYLNNLKIWENLTAVCNYFNKRYKRPDEINHWTAIYIANTNKKVNDYNENKLKTLQDNWEVVFSNKALYTNWDTDDFWRLKNEPSPLEIKYCKWCRVIFNTNTPNFKNWTMGTITDIKTKLNELTNRDEEIVSILIDWDTSPLDIWKNLWNKYESVIVGIDDEWNNILEHQVVWTYIQYPFQLWFGITIFKSQWKTFDNIIVDTGFIKMKEWDNWINIVQDHTVYVALSRVTSYEGIQLSNILLKQHIGINERVKKIVPKFIK